MPDDRPSLRRLIETSASPRLTLRNLARRAEINPSELSRLLNGTRRTPGPAVVRRLARALGRDPVYLLYLGGVLEEQEWRCLAPARPREAARKRRWPTDGATRHKGER